MEQAVSVLSDTICQLGEGPTYDPMSNRLFWFDILGRRLLERAWPDGETIVHELPEMASALAVVDEARQLLLTETGLHLRDTRTGALTRHIEVEAEDAGTRSNDARVHPSGAFWIGTMGKKAEKHAGSIYWYRRGELRKLYPDISIPNSICFSPDGAVAYFADTAKNIMFRVPCNPETGLPSGEPQIFLDHRGVEGGLDGSVIDADGLLWNARWGSSALDVYDRDGRRLRRIALPAKRGSCPAFVGPRADRIVVTSAWEGMDAAARVAEPDAGKLFLVDLLVNGRHEPRVAL
jgi:sugar lactone lactonase YvrE